MLSLSIPPLTSITPISTPHHRYLLPSKTHSISPPSVLKPCVLFASRLAPFEKRPLLSRFQLAVSSASDSSGQEEVKEEVENRSFADILFSKQEKPATDNVEEVTNNVEEGIEPVEDVQEEEEEGGYEYEEYEDEEEDSEYEDDEDYDEYNERLYSSTPKVVLKFIWMEKNIGLGLERHVPGSGSVPLTPYFFWPRKDAWEELKSAMEERPLVSEKRKIILLNQATDIINLWQQSGVVPSPTL